MVSGHKAQSPGCIHIYHDGSMLKTMCGPVGGKLTCSATGSIVRVCCASGGRPAGPPRIATCHCSIRAHGDCSCTQQCSQAGNSSQGDNAGPMDSTELPR